MWVCCSIHCGEKDDYPDYISEAHVKACYYQAGCDCTKESSLAAHRLLVSEHYIYLN